MKRNREWSLFKVLFALAASVFIFTFIVWKFISTDTFGKYLSIYINKYINQYTEVSIRYDKLSAKLFPLGLRIENLEVISLKPLGDINYLRTKIGQVDVDAKIFTLTFNKLQISNFELSNVEFEIDVKIDSKKTSDEKIKFEKYWDHKFLMNLLSFGKVDIFRVALNNAQIISNLVNAKVETASWEKYRNAIDVDLILKETEVNDKNVLNNFAWASKKNIQFPLLTSLQFKALIESQKLSVPKIKIGIEGNELQARATVKVPFDKKHLNFFGDVKLNTSQTQSRLTDKSRIGKLLTSMGVYQVHSESQLKFTGDILKYQIAGESVLKDLGSKYGEYKNINVDWLIEDEELTVSKVVLVDKNNGTAKTENTNIRFSLNKAKMMDFKAEVKVERFNLSNALSLLPSVSKSLQGDSSGELLVDLDKSDQSVKITSIKETAIYNFKLLTNSKKELLAVNKVVINNAIFDIGEVFTFAGGLLLENNQVVFEGSIGKDNIKVKTSEFLLDLDGIKTIAGISTEGKGTASIEVEGETKNPKLKFILKNIKHASIFGFYLGELNGNIIVDFVRDAIFLEKINSTLNPGSLKGDGYISLVDFTTDLDIKTKDLSTYDVIAIHKRLLPWDVSFLEKGISNSFIDYKISGKINQLKDLQVKANINMQRFTLGSEEIYDLRSSLLFKDKTLAMPDISFKKGKGTINIGLSSDFNEDVFRLAFKSKNLEASDFLLYNIVKPSFNSNMQLEGAYKSTKISSEGVFNIIATKARLNDELIDDSYIAMQWKDGVAKLQGKYGNNWIKLNAQLDFNQNVYDAANRSFVTGSVNVPNWGKILSLFASFDNDDPVLNGNLNFEFDSLFNYNRWQYADIDLWIKSLSLDHPSLQISKTNFDRITIQNGEIKKWDVQIKGIGRDQFISRAYGHIASVAEVESVFDFSLGKLNYFLGTYLDLNGFVQSQLKLRVSPGKVTYLGKLRSDDAIFNSKNLVTTLGKTKFLVEFDNKETRLVNWQSQMGAGQLNVTGNINWSDSLYPSVMFRYNLNNAKLQLATRSMTTVNGQGLLVGIQPPYIINGELKLSQSEILNEPGDFNFNQENKQSSVRYLPANQKQSKTDLFLLNVKVETETPVAIRNSIAELNLLTNLVLQGKVSDPKLAGQVTIKSDRKNIFILKNNQFKINRLNIVFDQRQPVSNPSLDIDAESPISTYVVRAKVYGTPKNYQLDLNSDPVLPRQSILSLIAFGYADNMSQNMSNEDRDALSSAGLGAFIFDQLKLNERLHSNLGLTLNVGTEYLNSSNSLLQGRTQQAGGGVVGQVRTATKLELRKKLDEKVGISVSSTVGGSAGQKQSMNLNYLVNRNVSLDAVYELNTDVSENQERAGRSAGGDVKFRWTFK